MEIRPLEDLSLESPTPAESGYQKLWQRYYDTIAIKERLNPRCRMTHCAKRFWNHMLEMPQEGGTALRGKAAPGRFPAELLDESRGERLLTGMLQL